MESRLILSTEQPLEVSEVAAVQTGEVVTVGTVVIDSVTLDWTQNVSNGE